MQTRRSWSLCCHSRGHSSTKLTPAGLFLWWKSPSARRRCWCCCSPSMAATCSTWSPSCRCSPQPGFSSCPQGRAGAHATPPQGQRRWGAPCRRACLLVGVGFCQGGFNTEHKEKHLQIPGVPFRGSSTSAGSALYLGEFQGNKQVPFHS